MLKLENSTSTQSLYRAIAELAYAMAKADGFLDEQERRTFTQIIESTLGKEASVLAQSRFEILDKTLSPEVESTYKKVLFTIKQNKSALNEEMIEKFITVITKVAEVAGICEEEAALLERFKADVLKIYFAK